MNDSNQGNHGSAKLMFGAVGGGLLVWFAALAIIRLPYIHKPAMYAGFALALLSLILLAFVALFTRNDARVFHHRKQGIANISALISLLCFSWFFAWNLYWDANRPPHINKVEAVPTETSGDSLVTVSVDVRDADREDFSYEWQIDGNKVDGEERRLLQFQAPAAPGNYKISVIVRDGKLSATDSTSINVATPKPACQPEITQQKKDADGKAVKANESRANTKGNR